MTILYSDNSLKSDNKDTMRITIRVRLFAKNLIKILRITIKYIFIQSKTPSTLDLGM